MEGLPPWDSLWPCYSCCRQFWVPSLGSFGPGCIGVVALIPSWIALAAAVVHFGLRPLWPLRPLWMRDFAGEEDELLNPDELELLKTPRWTRASLSLLFVAGLGIIASILSLALHEAAFFCVLFIPSAVSLLIVTIDRPRTPSGPIITTQSAVALVMLALLLSSPEEVARKASGVALFGLDLAIPLLLLAITCNVPMRDPDLGSGDISKPFDEPTSSLRSPEDCFSIWQWMTVSWMAPVISLGLQRQIHDEDVWFLPFQFHHARLHQLFRDVKGSVMGRLLKANAPDLMITTALGVLESLATLVQIPLLQQLLLALEGSEPNLKASVVYAALTLVLQLAKAQSGVFSLWFCRRCYERSRGEMITMIYEKTLRRKAFTFPSGRSLDEDEQQSPEENTQTSQATTIIGDEAGDGEDVVIGVGDQLRLPGQDAPLEDALGEDMGPKPEPAMLSWLFSRFRRPDYEKLRTSPARQHVTAGGPASTGKILNLMRNDVYEVAQRFWEFPQLITKPLNFILCVYLLWKILGPAALAGIVLLISAQLINAGLMRAVLAVEKSRRAITDHKLQLTSQFVEAIRHLRWYDWQDTWLGQILEARQVELRKRVIVNVLNRAIFAVNMMAAFSFPTVAFLAYTVVSGKPLTVDVAFPALNLFTQLETSLRELPELVTVLLNAKVAMDRIESFMAEPNKEDVDHDESRGPAGPLEISVARASFSWPGSSRVVLRDLSLSCRPGLTVVCGQVGIGKTALLQAILGELDQHGGDRHTPDEAIGYCTQTPWLQSMSIRENILFSSAHDERRYRQVLDACALLPDLAEFKAGDRHEVGENGVGLSGGQKARVALARAVYSRARILLLDDPIAALDHQTAETIMRKLFGKNSALTKGRLVIFVTHRLDLAMPYADQLLEVVENGTVKTLDREGMETNADIRHLIAAAAATEAREPADDPAEQDDGGEPADKLIEEERRVHGGVMASVYWKYIKAGSIAWWAALLACFVAFRGIRIVYYLFLKEWGEAYPPVLANSTLTASWPPPITHHLDTNSAQLAHEMKRRSNRGFHPVGHASTSGWLDFLHLPSPDVDVHPWILCFFVLAMCQVLGFIFSDAFIIIVIYNAGKRLFSDVMHRVSNATFRFYDVTPVGRLMNRLTSDIGTIDGQIANQLMEVAWQGVAWVSAVAVIASVTPMFLVLTLAMTATFVYLFMRFLPASQSLRRLEMVSLTPLMSNFGTLLDGLVTVRAFQAQTHFQARIIVTTDAFQKMDHFYWSLQAWITYRFDMLSAVSTFALTIFALVSGLSSGTVAFVLASATSFVSTTHILCRKYGDLQMQFVSVERVIELLDQEQEPPGDVAAPAVWPTHNDSIVFDHVTLRYAANLDPSLVDVSFRIPPGATVAVTGRTGSGKSTLALSLLGTLLPDADHGGAIRIGNIDIARVDKHALRRRVSFVAQDPVLFPGTLRQNLDPLGEHSDEACAAVLERLLGGAGSFTLASRVDGGGKNLSQGQRQLVGLGRAVLRRSPVVILDEATASIDVKTAYYIQEVLRQELAQSTVITIAHRIEAVKDATYYIVLDKGRVADCGPTSRV